ncbi:exo-rhamnogalacturonan lyase family protein [Paenibacillus cremeus]|uniref:Uncharacterized protein n=1 Tax=Paenibacillus cremeus TaxID=2163881 RepID=A0A559K9P2_9BACL|nr:hypothetical protein [Paenibacillus cremeus]TVY08844.1 hypothetical protein FPZ49_16345 [Paenibacillus cremeus]
MIRLYGTIFKLSQLSADSYSIRKRTGEGCCWVKAADESRFPVRLVCNPEYYYECRAFGVWSLPNRETEQKRFIEEQLDVQKNSTRGGIY